MTNNHNKIKTIIAILSFLASLVFGAMGFFAIPVGEISFTVLLYTAELLLFCSIALGISVKNNELLVEITKIMKEMKG